MTALSYVMSLMPPTIINDLKLARARLPRRADGPEVHRLPRRSLPARPRRPRAATSTRWPSSPARTPSDSATTRPGSTGSADVLAPLLLRTPAQRRLAPTRATCIDQLRMAWGMRGLDVRGTADATRLFTMSHRRRARRVVRVRPRSRACMAINGVIGTWAGPEEPGTAYVMMHHTIGDVGDGQLGVVGLSDRRHGRGLRRHPALGRVLRRRGPHRLAGRAHPRPQRHGSSAWPPPTARSCERRHRRRRDPPADHVPAPDRPRASCPTTSSRDLERWRSRSRHGQGQRRPVRAARLRRLARTRRPGAAQRRRSSCATRSTTCSGPSRRRGEGRACDPALLRRRHPVDGGPDAVPRGHARHVAVHPVGAPARGRASRTTPSWRRTPTG